jgi:hypothetical protein
LALILYIRRQPQKFLEKHPVAHELCEFNTANVYSVLGAEVAVYYKAMVDHGAVACDGVKLVCIYDRYITLAGIDIAPVYVELTATLYKAEQLYIFVPVRAAFLRFRYRIGMEDKREPMILYRMYFVNVKCHRFSSKEQYCVKKRQFFY